MGAIPPGEVAYAVRPITSRAAIEWIKEVHRHLPNIQGGLFATSVHCGAERVAVGIAGNPARVWQGTGRIVISRVAAREGLPRVIGSDGREHPAPACTMVYRSLCDASRSLGYREAWTYTLPGEDGASLRAAGFIFLGWTGGGEWSRASRPRNPAVSTAKKGRWVRPLTRAARREIEAMLAERRAA